MKICLPLLLFVAYAKAQAPLPVSTGNLNCVACLGKKNTICSNVGDGTGCFVNPGACPTIADQHTNILTECTQLNGNANAVISINEPPCLTNIFMSDIYGSMGVFLTLKQNEFCATAIVNNINHPLIYYLQGTNVASVS